MNRQSSIRRNASLEKANRLLLAFSEATPELGVMDLARRVGLNKSTVSRFVATLHELGLLERVDHGRKYRLGLRVFELGTLAARHRPLYAQAEPAVEKLAAQLRETVTLAVLLGRDLVFLHKADRGVDAASAALGRRYPAHCSASGKALLGLLPADERAEYLASRLVRRTESSIVVPRILERGRAEGAFRAEGDVRIRLLPGGWAAVALAEGEYARFPKILEAYDAGYDWIVRHGHKMVESPREVWIGSPESDGPFEIVWRYE